MRLYLAGSVAGRSTKDVREQRLAAAAAIRARGWTPVDPINGEYEALKRRRKIDDADSGLSPTSIALKDRFQIDHVDVVLWLTADVASYGSCMEAGYAWARGTAIIAVDAARTGRRNAFVQHCCMYIADNLDEALDFIGDYLAEPALEASHRAN